jgi:hypothetical protein
MKEPVNSIPEAQQRKKDLIPWLIISGVLCILFIGFFFLFYFGLGYMVANKIIKRFECFTCNSCNEVAKLETKEDFDKYITYEIVEQKAVFKGVEHPASDDSGRVAYIKATVTGKAVVLVHLTCPKCGAKKDLVYTVKTFEAKREEKDSDDKNYVRRERNFSCKRSFYVGDAITEEDVKAKYLKGTLEILVPKNKEKQITKKNIAID